MPFRKPNPAPTPRASPSPWRAVTIIPCSQACETARTVTQKRWLYADAPRLPLAGCDALVCDCRYKHLPDRRDTDRRRIDRTGLPRNFNGSEQRGPRRGRRVTD